MNVKAQLKQRACHDYSSRHAFFSYHNIGPLKVLLNVMPIIREYIIFIV